MWVLILLVSNIGFEYLTVDPIAHRVGMGYAQIGDGYDVHYNPAGLAYNMETQYSACYLNYIANTHFGYLGYESNQLGIGIKYFNGGTFKKTDELGREYGTFGVHFIDINVGKGFFYKDIGIGVSLKGVYTNIDTLYSIGAGIDLGAIYIFADPEVQLGLAIKNIGSGIKPYIESNELLPYEVNIGGMKRFSFGWIGLDLVKPALMNFGVRIGGSYSLFENFHFKASYNTLLSSVKTGSSGLDFLVGLTAGFSLKANKICVNYNYSPYFDLGGCHRISVSLGG
jgi:hypothetical protein